MKKEVVEAVDRFSASAGLGEGSRSRLLQRLREYLAVPTRRNGRGAKPEVLSEVRTTLMHLNSATRWQEDGGLGNLSKQARKLVTTATHAKVPFEDLMAPAAKLRGRVNKAGKRRNDCKPIAGCEPLRLELPKGYVVERLCTLAALIGAGKALGNCARDDRWLHERLQQRKSDFYLVRDQGDKAVAMCQVDLETDEIAEFLGEANAEVRLPRRAVAAMLSNLRVDGDHIDACLQRGAASIFTTGAADPEVPDYSKGQRCVWAVKGQLVVQQRKRRGKWWRGQWSSFRWDGTNWEGTNASRLDRLDGLMTRHRRIVKLARKAAKWMPSPRPSTLRAALS